MCAKPKVPKPERRFRVRCGNLYCIRRDGVLQPQPIMRADFATYFESERQAEAEIKASVTLIENIRASMFADSAVMKHIVAIKTNEYQVEEYQHELT